MTKTVADLVQGEAVIEQALRAGVPERMRPAALALDANASHAPEHQTRNPRPAERTDGGLQREEDLAVCASRPGFAQVADDRVADTAR